MNELNHGTPKSAFWSSTRESGQLSNMQCDVCHRSADDRLPFICTFCARNTLYSQRMQLAQTLIEKERLGKEVKDATVSQPILHKTPSPRTHKTPESRQNPCWTLQSVEAEQTSSEKKAEAILCHTQILREEIQKAKDEIAKRKARFDRRRTEFASAKEELLQSQAVGTEPVERSIWRTRQRWDLMHVKTTESRFLLCKEAAKLYGLHRQKRTKGSLGKDVYYIGGVTIPNLRDLNSTLLDQSRFLSLTSF